MRTGQARKRDANEAEIVAALRRLGALVLPLSEPGAPDLLVLHRGRLLLMEIKMPTGRTTMAQDRRSAEGWPVSIIRSVDDALRHLGGRVSVTDQWASALNRTGHAPVAPSNG